MPITADYHMHSSFSGDSDSPMEEMILQGIRIGLTHMCFTEHQDFDFPVSEQFPAGFFEINPDSYLYDFLKYREKYADKIALGFGVELGLQPHLSKKNAAFAKAHDYDFIIASSHLCNRQDPGFPEFYEGKSEKEAFREYFESILENLKFFSNFDVYGHLDYIVRYAPNQDKNYSYEQYRDIIDAILEKLIADGKGIEVNTAGLSKGLKDVHPCRAVIRRYKELGGEIITVGSDAHRPEHIAAHFDKAAAVLSECGFRYYCTFEKRSAAFHKIR
ncbi:MAG: histidinol-phosphatase HisJ family protein [Clostridium sp.]|nr:histidinol-phosphatase HisJ family protein [Clostridium sp.]